jgi:hypothetical protein
MKVDDVRDWQFGCLMITSVPEAKRVGGSSNS